MAVRVSTTGFEAELLRSSYHEFFRSFWHLTAAEKLVDSWYIEKLCNQLQLVAERVFRGEPKEDMIWNCPPGTSKSTCVSILWQPWVWTRMPSARFITGSYSERLAMDHSRKSRDVVTSEKYQTLFPEIKLREDQSTKSYWVNSYGGMRYAVGVGGSVIGHHAHALVIDDPVDPLGALSELTLAEVNTWMNETLSRRKVDLETTPTVTIMQRLHQDDPSGNQLERKNPPRHFCIPGDDTWEIKPPEWKSYYQDGLLDPIRIPWTALHEAQETLGEVGYAGQYGQQPSPRGGSQFKVDMLQFQHTAPSQWKRGPFRFWDKAATVSKGAAFTAGVKIALDKNNRVWILDVIRNRWDSGTRERMIATTAVNDGKLVKVGIEQEPGSGGKESAESTVKRLTLMGFRCKAFPATAAKELRADPFSEQVNMGNVVLLVAPWNKEFVEELRFFPASRYKDMTDAACLIGETEVQTLSGPMPIRLIKAGDMVLTRHGYRRVSWAGVTGEASELACVSFADGRCLVGTYNHPLLTQPGEWMTMDSMAASDKVLVWESSSWQSTSTREWCSRGSPTVEGFLMGDTFRAREERTLFTEQFGGRLMETSPLDVTFITRTTIPSTTLSRILSASRRRSIDRHMPRNTEPLSDLHTWRRYDLYQSPGMDLQRAESCIVGSARLQQRGVLSSPTSASSVASRFLLSTPESANTALRSAMIGCVPDREGERFTRSPVRSVESSSRPMTRNAVSVRDLAARRNWLVYNLEVEEHPEFFANGVLVHNSGGFAMMTTARIRIGALG